MIALPVNSVEVQTIELGLAVSHPPAMGDDGTVYVVASDDEGQGRLICVGPDGLVSWEFFPDVPGAFGNLAVAPDGSVVTTATDSEITEQSYSLYAINADGTKKWSFSNDVAFRRQPAIAGDGTIIVGSVDDKVHAFRSDGSRAWSYGVDLREAPAISHDGSVYLPSGGDARIVALSLGGEFKWRAGGTPDRVTTPVAIADDGTLVAGWNLRGLIAINPDGTVKWRTSLDGEVLFTPVIASNGTIYCIGGRDVIAVNQDGEELFRVNYESIHSATAAPPMLTGDDDLLYLSYVLPSLEVVTAGLEFKERVLFDDSDFFIPVMDPNGTVSVAFRSGRIVQIGGFSAPTQASWPSHRRDGRLSGSLSPVLSRPPPPGNLRAGDGTLVAKIEISWDEPAMLQEYDLFRSESSDLSTAQPIAELAGVTSFVDGDIELEKSYFYWVRARNSLGSSEFAGPVVGRATPGTRLLWNRVMGTLHTAFVIRHDGIVGILDRSENLLRAVKPETGEDVWSVDVVSERNLFPVCLDDNSILVASRSMLQLFDTDGAVLWNLETEISNQWMALGPNGSIYVAYSEGLREVTPLGQIGWEFPVAGGLTAAPVVDSGGTIYVVGSEKRLFAIDSAGSEKWNADAEAGFMEVIAVRDTAAILWSAGNSENPIRAFNSSGMFLWSVQTDSGFGRLLSASDGSIRFGDRTFVGKADSAGSILWQYELDRDDTQSGVISVDGTTVVNTYGSVDAIGSDGQLAWRFEYDLPNENIARESYLGLSGGLLVALISGRGTDYIYALQTPLQVDSGTWHSPNANAQNTRRLNKAPPTLVLMNPRFDVDGQFVFEFNFDTDATPSIEHSVDLKSWLPANLPPDSVEQVEEHFKIRVSVDGISDARRFYRVVVP